MAWWLYRVDPAQDAPYLASFITVLPFFAVGLVSSFWGSLGVWLGQRFSRTSSDGAAPISSRPAPRRRLRPVVVLNAVAIGLVAVSLIAGLNDPASIRVATPLATYIGARDLANDVRAKMNLALAVGTLDQYKSKHETYRGFDAKTAEDVQPALTWQDGLSDPTATAILVVDVLPTGARLATLSASGRAYCIEKLAGGQVQFGSSGSAGSDPNPQGNVESAMAHCGSMPWTSSSPGRAPTLECLPEYGDYIICRMVEVLIHNIMQDPETATES